MIRSHTPLAPTAGCFPAARGSARDLPAGSAGYPSHKVPSPSRRSPARTEVDGGLPHIGVDRPGEEECPVLVESPFGGREHQRGAHRIGTFAVAVLLGIDQQSQRRHLRRAAPGLDAAQRTHAAVVVEIVNGLRTAASTCDTERPPQPPMRNIFGSGSPVKGWIRGVSRAGVTTSPMVPSPPGILMASTRMAGGRPVSPAAAGSRTTHAQPLFRPLAVQSPNRWRRTIGLLPPAVVEVQRGRKAETRRPPAREILDLGPRQEDGRPGARGFPRAADLDRRMDRAVSAGPRGGRVAVAGHRDPHLERPALVQAIAGFHRPEIEEQLPGVEPGDQRVFRNERQRQAARGAASMVTLPERRASTSSDHAGAVLQGNPDRRVEGRGDLHLLARAERPTGCSLPPCPSSAIAWSIVLETSSPTFWK